MFLNLGCGNRPIKDEGWINVDKFDNVGADQVVDLFKMPFPWEDNSIDGVKCSHFLEHVPHSLVPHNMDTFPWTDPYQIHLLKLDGFFAFFQEIGRILKPNGWIEIESPFGWSTGAFQDPTHTRYLVLQTFGYLSRPEETDRPFDYGVKYFFKLEKPQDLTWEIHENPVVSHDNPDAFGLQFLSNINILRNFRIKLVVDK